MQGALSGAAGSAEIAIYQIPLEEEPGDSGPAHPTGQAESLAKFATRKLKFKTTIATNRYLLAGLF